MGLTSQRDSKLSHPQANRHVSVKLKIFLCIYSMKILHEKVKATQQDSQRGDVYKLETAFMRQLDSKVSAFNLIGTKCCLCTQ